MVIPLETTINYSCKCHVTYTVIILLCFLFVFSPKMEASNFESILECISDGVNKVLVLCPVHDSPYQSLNGSSFLVPIL